jgi:hypothetical protein
MQKLTGLAANLLHPIQRSLMADKQKSLDDKALVQEAVIGIKGTPKELSQLSSSGRAAQLKRMAKGLDSLDKATRDLQTEQAGSASDTAQQGKRTERT